MQHCAEIVIAGPGPVDPDHVARYHGGGGKGGSQPNYQAQAQEQAQASKEITDEYVKRMPVETTQALFDKINQHGTNDVTAEDAMAQALKGAPPPNP